MTKHGETERLRNVSKILERAYLTGAKTIVIPPRDPSSPTIKLPIDLKFKRVIVKTPSGHVIAEYDTAVLVKAGILKLPTIGG